MKFSKILQDLVLSSRINQCWDTSGLDSYEQCLDQQWYKSYPHQISYQYNSRGFRDSEWPSAIDDLQNSIWCIGDSFTVGLGSPIEHTWPYLLQKNTGKRTINISMDGASNDWIAGRVLEINKEICPNIIVTQWSYLHRREDYSIPPGDHEDRRMRYTQKNSIGEKDHKNFIRNLNTIKNCNCKIIQSIIPYASTPEDQELSAILIDHNIIEISHQDWARDKHHYDIKTAQMFVDQVITML